MSKSSYRPMFLATVLLTTSLARACAQGLFNNGAAITVTTGGSCTVRGTLFNAATATISNGGTLNVSGNTTNNGTINALAAGILRLDGTTVQTLSGTSPIYAKDVLMNNAAGVTLSTPLNVDGTLFFSAGILTATVAAPVIFTAGAGPASTPTDASHIDGYATKLGTGSFVYPVGNATRYQPVGVNLSGNSSGMTARYYAADAGSAPFGTTGSSSTPLLYYNKKEYWDLVPAGAAAGTVTLYYDGYNDGGVTNPADLRVAHKTGGQWLNEGGTASGSTSAGSVTSGSIASWSPFALGSVSAGSPLPVKLMHFSGVSTGASNRIDWATAAEEAGTLFVVERSADAFTFSRMGTLGGTGSNSRYSFCDSAPPPLAYYRLLVREAGGAATFSQTLVIRNGAHPASQTVVYPVPATTKLTIVGYAETLAGTAAVLRDVSGKAVRSCLLQPGSVTLDIAALAPGTYTLHLADGTALKVTK